MVRFKTPYTIHVSTGLPRHAWIEWRRGHLEFTDRDLAWALFVTGRATGHEFRHGQWLGLWEYASRYGTIRAYLESDHGSTCLRRTALAEFLDPTEKGNLSYSLGQALTGIFCEKELAIDRMLHIDFYGKQYDANGRRRVILDRSGNRPDLFGYGHGLRVIAEAKGRSSASAKERIELGHKMHWQLNAVQEIDGSSTAADWKIGLVAVISGTRPAHLYVFVDPMIAPLRQGARQSQLLHDAHQYYRELEPGYPPLDYSRMDLDALLESGRRNLVPYFRRFTRLSETVDDGWERDGNLLKVKLSDIGVTIGLLIEIVDLVSSLDAEGNQMASEELVQFSTQIEESIRTARRTNHEIYRDGSFFQTDWPESSEEIVPRL